MHAKSMHVVTHKESTPVEGPHTCPFPFYDEFVSFCFRDSTKKEFNQRLTFRQAIRKLML